MSRGFRTRKSFGSLADDGSDRVDRACAKDFDDLDRVVSRRVQAAIERLAEGEGDIRRLTAVAPNYELEPAASGPRATTPNAFCRSFSASGLLR